MKRWLARLVGLDRRWLFLAMGAAIVVPLVAPIGLRVVVQKPTRAAYEAVRELPPGSKILISADYDPGSSPEMQPFLEALIDFAWSRELDVVAMTLWPAGAPLVDRAFAAAATKRHVRYGSDYVNLGFKEGRILVMTKL